MASRAKRRKEEEYKRALAEIIQGNTRDRHFETATITDVELSSDLKYAKVFVDLIGGEEQKEEALDTFNDKEGFFRTNLAHRVNPRFTPELEFILDRSWDRMNRINTILQEDKENEDADPGNE
ncbi:MAG: 30S ribosome-binding factor RbfA [Candidatus Acetothermia bacterium]